MTYEATLAIRLDEGRIAFYGGLVPGRAEASLSCETVARIAGEWRRRVAQHGERPLGDDEAAALGRALGEALWPSSIAGPLERTRRICASRGARLRLRTLGAEDLPIEAARLGGEPLGLDPVVRPYRDVGDPALGRPFADRAFSGRPSVAAGERLRALIVCADPATARYRRLSWLQEEAAAIAAAAGGSAEVHILEEADPTNIRRRVRSLRPHVFHFSGHAEARATGGTLVTRGPRDGAGAVRSDELAVWLVEAGTRLAVLMACDAAPIARQLVEAGIEAAVGAQIPLRAGAPLALSAALYRALARGATFEEAVAEAREAARDRLGDWMALTLFVSGPPGRLLAPTEASPDHASRTNLPARERPMVGRHGERAELRRLLIDERRRLVSLRGVGGIGKTRLATEVGRELLPSFPHGVWLAPTPEDATEESLLDALRAVPALNGAVANPRFMAILDGGERALPHEAAGAVAAFLEAVPGATVLVTGREALRLENASELRLGPLETPIEGAGRSDAQDLFLQTAADALPGFGATQEELEAVGAICRRLSGHPLALVVAASRLRHLGVLDLADLLDEDGSSADGEEPGRLRRVVEASVRALREEERSLLGRLGVFSGEFGPNDAAAVYGLAKGAVYQGLGRLQDHSLVEFSTKAGRTRYRLLDPIRETVRDLLPPTEAERRAHARHYAARAADSGVEGADLGNLRAALAYAVETDDAPLVAGFAQTLARPLLETGFWKDLDRLLAAGERLGDPRIEATLLGLRGALRARRGDDAGSLADWKLRALRCAELGDSAGRADALTDIACRGFWSDLPDVVEFRVKAAIEAARALDRPELLASGYVLYGLLGERCGDPAHAREWAERAAAIVRSNEGDDPWRFVDTNLGRLFAFVGDLERADAAYRRVLRAARTSERRHHLAGALEGLARVYEAAGRPVAAARCALAAATLFAQLGSAWRARADALAERLCRAHPRAHALARAAPGGWATVADEILDDDRFGSDSPPGLEE